MRTAATVMTVALCVAATGAASPQAPITKTKSVSATATIQAIDATGRTITLKDESGVEDTYSVGPEVKRFNELKVGDTVKMTYYESVVLVVRKPGEAPVATAGERGDHARHGRAAGRDHGGAGQDDGDRQGHRSGCAIRDGHHRRTDAP